MDSIESMMDMVVPILVPALFVALFFCTVLALIAVSALAITTVIGLLVTMLIDTFDYLRSLWPKFYRLLLSTYSHAPAFGDSKPTKRSK